MTTPDISVVVCTRNRAELLRGALASLYDLATEDEFSYEIVVVDNGSTDETGQVIGLAAQESKHPLRGVVASEPGIVAARNRGIDEANGKWIAFFGDDQLADWHWLAELHRGALEKNCRVVGGSVQLALPADCKRQFHSTVLSLLGESLGGDLPQRFGGRLTPGCGNLMIERGVFDQVGRIEPAIDGRGEYIELCDRIQRAKIDAWYFPTAIVHQLTPADRLERDYLLGLAERTGRGIALLQRKSLGIIRFSFAWVARLTRLLAIEYPRVTWVAMSRNSELKLARRCELRISRGYLSGASRTVPAAQPTAGPSPPRVTQPVAPSVRRPTQVFVLRSGEPTAVMDFPPRALGASSPRPSN
jgi:GT2 family glycosyltransferase